MLPPCETVALSPAVPCNLKLTNSNSVIGAAEGELIVIPPCKRALVPFSDTILTGLFIFNVLYVPFANSITSPDTARLNALWKATVFCAGLDALLINIKEFTEPP